MIYKKDKQSFVIPDELQDSNYPWGFQNKKIEKQSVRGLSPKFCYATNSAGQTWNNGVTAAMNFNTYTNNDYRTSKTANKITIPAAGLYLVKGYCALDAYYIGERYIQLYKNGGTTLETGYQELFMRNQDQSNTFSIFTILNLNQNDVLELYFTNNCGSTVQMLANNSFFSITSFILS